MWQYSFMGKILIKLLGKPFSTKQALNLGISKSTLTRMVQSGILERINRGVYQITEETLNGKGLGDGSGLGMGSGSGAGHRNESGDAYSDLEKSYISASLRCGKQSAVCLLSALEYHHLTDEIPAQVWMMVPESKRVVSKDLKIVRCRNPKWKIGIQKAPDFQLTTIERTLIDCLIHKKIIGHQVALAALKNAVREKKVKLGNLYDMAKKMGVAHRIKPYIEVLGS